MGGLKETGGGKEAIPNLLRVESQDPLKDFLGRRTGGTRPRPFVSD